MNTLRLNILFLVFITIANGETQLYQSDSTSLADVFPLAVGYQWTYGYYWEYNDVFISHVIYSSCDTGNVVVQVIGEHTTPDSTRWTMRQEAKLCSRYNTAPFSGPQIVIDTFEIIELHQGNHQLYRIGNSAKLSKSVFPFPSPSLYPHSQADTAKTERYRLVNDSGKAQFDFWGDQGFEHSFIFEKNKGLLTTHTHGTCLCGETWVGSHVLRSSTITGVSQRSRKLPPQGYFLEQNYPNPFNPTTTISFGISSNSYVTLKIFDYVGREIATLISRELSPGFYSQPWNAEKFPSSFYLYRLQTDTFTETKKLLLLK